MQVYVAFSFLSATVHIEAASNTDNPVRVVANPDRPSVALSYDRWRSRDTRPETIPFELRVCSALEVK